MLQRNRSLENFSELLGVYARAGGRSQEAREAAARLGLIRMSDTKASSASDLDGIGQGLQDTFFSSLEHGGGVFDYVAARGRRAALRTRAFIPQGPIVATVVEEGLSIPAGRFVLDGAGLQPVKVAALACATVEALSTPEGSESLATELRESITLATDTSFLAALATAAGYSDTMTGTPINDIAALLAGITVTGASDLVLVVTPSVAAAMCTDPTVFPGMSPVGGFACGIECLVTAACPGLMLIDCKSILTGDQKVEFSYTTAASIELSDDPAGDSTLPAAATGKTVSLFQTDGIGVLATRHFAAKTVRASGVGVLSAEVETT